MPYYFGKEVSLGTVLSVKYSRSEKTHMVEIEIHQGHEPPKSGSTIIVEPDLKRAASQNEEKAQSVVYRSDDLPASKGPLILIP